MHLARQQRVDVKTAVVATCSICQCPVGNVKTENLFEQARDRIGDDNLSARCWDSAKRDGVITGGSPLTSSI